MERAHKNTTKHWGLFAISLIAMLALLFSPWAQWFWLILPLVCTEFALAMDFL
jgi:hypothetical protein